MNRVAMGILATVLVAGCAMEAGAPPEGTGPQPGEVAVVPAIRTTGGGPTGSAVPQKLPEPSPWYGEPIANPGNDGTGQVPEPSPWLPGPTTPTVQGAGTNPQSGPSSGKSTGSATTHPQRIGHWDLKDVAPSE
jgi:hypothetical protein